MTAPPVTVTPSGLATWPKLKSLPSEWMLCYRKVGDVKWGAYGVDKTKTSFQIPDVLAPAQYEACLVPDPGRSNATFTVSQPAPPVPVPPMPSAPTPAPVPSKLIVGLNNISNFDYMANLVTLVKGIGVTHDRIAVEDGADISEVTRAVSHGLTPLVVYNPATGSSPATYASQVLALVNKLSGTGVTLVEFINEPDINGWTPTTYAAAYSAAHAAIVGKGITLIMYAAGDWENNGTWSQDDAGGGWIHDTIFALPGGATTIDAWSTHPYGPMVGVQNGDTGWAAMANHRKWAVKYGSSAPWYITEVGQQLDGAAAVTLAQQAADITQYLNDCASSYPWVQGIWWYAVVDDSTGQWGIFDVLDTANSVSLVNVRPSFTALASWIKAHA